MGVLSRRSVRSSPPRRRVQTEDCFSCLPEAVQNASTAMFLCQSSGYLHVLRRRRPYTSETPSRSLCRHMGRAESVSLRGRGRDEAASSPTPRALGTPMGDRLMPPPKQGRRSPARPPPPRCPAPCALNANGGTSATRGRPSPKPAAYPPEPSPASHRCYHSCAVKPAPASRRTGGSSAAIDSPPWPTHDESCSPRQRPPARGEALRWVERGPVWIAPGLFLGVELGKSIPKNGPAFATSPPTLVMHWAVRPESTAIRRKVRFRGWRPDGHAQCWLRLLTECQSES